MYMDCQFCYKLTSSELKTALKEANTCTINYNAYRDHEVTCATFRNILTQNIKVGA